MLGMRLCVLHNLYFYNHLMTDIRAAIEKGEYASFKKQTIDGMMEFDGAESKSKYNIAVNWRKG